MSRVLMIALTSVQKQLHYAAETNFIVVGTVDSIKNACCSIASKKKSKCNLKKRKKSLRISAIITGAPKAGAQS